MQNKRFHITQLINIFRVLDYKIIKVVVCCDISFENNRYLKRTQQISKRKVTTFDGLL